MSKFVTMYGENKPSTLINDTRWGGIFFCENPVRSAMPNERMKVILNIIILLLKHAWGWLMLIVYMA